MRKNTLVFSLLIGLTLFHTLHAPSHAEWLQHSKLWGDDTDGGDDFGNTMTLDGDRLAIAAEGREFFDGGVYIFERNVGGPENWGQVAMIIPAGEVFRFATCVDLDGDRLAATMAADNLAFVFERKADGSWLEVARLEKPPDPETDTFGNSVAIEGDTLFVGSALDDQIANDAGALWVYRRGAIEPGQWELVDKLTSPLSTGGARFGNDAAVASGILVVGAEQDSEKALQAGAAHIFEKNINGEWIETAKLMASDGESSDTFGRRVAISGWTVLISADQDDDHGNASGAAYVFERDASGTWAETAKLTASDSEQGQRFGTSVAISADLIAVGAEGDDDPGGDSGAAYLFTRQGGEWPELLKLEPEELEDIDNFGTSIAADPRTVIVGSPFDDDRGGSAGAAYIYLERDLALSSAGTCPGDVNVTLTGATAQAPVAMLAGLPGGTEVPAGRCAGAALALAQPKLLGSGLTDSDGGLSLLRTVRVAACGLSLQVIDPVTCAVSNAEPISQP